MKAITCYIASYEVFLLVFLGFLTAFGPFVTDMYLPALPSMTHWFGTSVSMIQLSLTACMVGLALGQLVFGPMSDRYGRRSVLLWTLSFFIVSTALCLFSSGINQFIVCRLAQGVAAAGSIVIARSIATDLFKGRELARILGIVGSINGIAPVMAPVVGGAMTDSIGWQGIFIILALIGCLLLLSCFHFKESLPRERRVQSQFTHVLSYFKPLFVNRTYMGYMSQLGFAQAALFVNIASAPFIMQVHYGFTPFQFSLYFGLNALAIVISAALAARFKRIENGAMYGAYGLMFFSIGEMIALFSGCSFWLYECFILGILFSLGLCFTSATTLAMDSGRQYSGSASALLGAVSFAFGGLVSPLVGLGDQLRTTGILFVVCGFCVLICAYIGRTR